MGNLKSGETYKFLILKNLSVPDLGSELFILKGPDEKKYILDGSFYSGYGFESGQIINCKVDKINCSGKVFLEPEHPLYKAGKEYTFKLLEINEGKDAWGHPLYIAFVTDKLKQKWSCVVNKKAADEKGMSCLRCRIDRIKKAGLFLSSVDYPPEKANLVQGNKYEFIIKGVSKHHNREHYILAGPDGRDHFILKEYYKDYGFMTGQVIRGEITGQREDLSYKIEPDHPLYEIGSSYDFRFLKVEAGRNIAGETEGVISVCDKLGKVTQVKANEKQVNERGYCPESIKCRVIRFKKGKLQLENLE